MSYNAVVYNSLGVEVTKLSINPIFTDTPFNNSLVSQYLRVFSVNQRVGNAHTKTRGEVSGTGKKPFKQKGTGRARAGSARSPLWVGGGITHGPRSKYFRLEFPKKMRRLVFLSAASLKFNINQVTITESLKSIGSKTSDFSRFISLPIFESKRRNPKFLLITSDYDPDTILATRNLKNVKVAMVSNVSAYDLLATDRVILDTESLIKLESKYENK